ncbi:MAG: hypothetical protein ABIW47_01550 [Ginsengibacter sp.]
MYKFKHLLVMHIGLSLRLNLRTIAGNDSYLNGKSSGCVYDIVCGDKWIF